MRRGFQRLFGFAACLLVAGGATPPATSAEPPGRPAPIAGELRDKDRVLFVGDAFFERDHEFGLLEAALTSRFPDRTILFRNLGWSGDTVWGDSRAGFETAAEGFKRRQELILGLKPTVVLICYGMNESFDGPAGLSHFVEGLNRLLDGIAPAQARTVLVSPIDHERLPAPLPDPTAHRANLRLYRDAMAGLAKQRGLPFVDLIRFRVGDGTRPEATEPRRETTDGIHLNAVGYRNAAVTLASAFDPQGITSWKVSLDREGKPSGLGGVSGVTLSETASNGRGVSLVVRDERLPDAEGPVAVPLPVVFFQRVFMVSGLELGPHTLRVDGQAVATADAEAWSKGVRLEKGPEFDQAEALRRAILEKNRLVFYRWRPQNETYLFGFRKHEQGNNAGEIPLFDPLVAEKEAVTARLKEPVAHRYELTGGGAVSR